MTEADTLRVACELLEKEIERRWRLRLAMQAALWCGKYEDVRVILREALNEDDKKGRNDGT